MECYTSLSFFSTLKPPLSLLPGSSSIRRRSRSMVRPLMEVSSFSYQKFIDFALDETKRHTLLLPSTLQVILALDRQIAFLAGTSKLLKNAQENSPFCMLLQDSFSSLMGMDGKAELQMLSFQATKIRLLRSLYIEGSEGMQVLDFAVFAEPEFDLPIFCANFFTTANTNIVVLDLNPLHDVINQKDYKEKYYKSIIPLGLKYAELLPWGGKITSESLRFFSPIVIWTKFSSSQDRYSVLYSAFMDYYKAWLELMDQAVEETDSSQISCNCEAQHRYLTWRAEKDPGHRVLKRLFGETLAKDLVKNFLFSGINELGSKTFLDYFPEYKCKDGTVNEKRSIIGKSFEKRPWDTRGEFIGNSFR